MIGWLGLQPILMPLAAAVLAVGESLPRQRSVGRRNCSGNRLPATVLAGRKQAWVDWQQVAMIGSGDRTAVVRFTDL